jgi:hypothetical protein
MWTMNSGGVTTNVSHAKIYGFKVWESGILVRDFIPVRFTNELGVSEGAMFDRANPTVGMNPDGSPRTDGLYRNRGTGVFSWGDDLPTGVYALDIPFAATTVVCDSLKVHSIQSVQGADDARDEDDPAGLDAAAAVSGEVVLDEGRNAEPYLDGNRLRLDIFKGAGLGERCQSAVSGGQRCGTVLFTINGERPGSDGDIRIVGDGGIAVTPDPENHAVEIRMDDEATHRMADGCITACPAYTKKTSVLTFNANGGSGTMTTGKIATYGRAMPTGITLPTRTGYTFNGFFDAASGGTKYYNADGTGAKTWDKDTTSGTTLYAQWTVA